MLELTLLSPSFFMLGQARPVLEAFLQRIK
jgi:hypothetical protein